MLIVFIRDFSDTCILYAFVIYKKVFIVTVIERLFYATIRGSQWGDCYKDRKVLIFFKNGQLFYVIFKSYPSLLKSSEFMTRVVSKHSYNTPALKPQSWLLHHSFHNFNETTSLDQSHILRPSLLPNFLALALHCSHLKSSIYTCGKFFHIYQNCDKGAVTGDTCHQLIEYPYLKGIHQKLLFFGLKGYSQGKSTPKLNSSVYEKCEHGHLGR